MYQKRFPFEIIKLLTFIVVNNNNKFDEKWNVKCNMKYKMSAQPPSINKLIQTINETGSITVLLYDLTFDREFKLHEFANLV